MGYPDSHYNDLLHRLQSVRRRIYHEKISVGALISVRIALLTGICVVLCELLFHFSVSMRTAAVIAWPSSMAGLFAWKAGIPFLRLHGILPPLSLKEIALLIGEHFSGVKDRVRNLIEIIEQRSVSSDGERPFVSPELVDASLEDIHSATASVSFTDIVSFARVKESLRNLVFILLAAGIFFAYPGNAMSDAMFRLIHCRTDFTPPLPFRIAVQPGNKEIVKDDPIVLSFSVLPATSTDLQTEIPKELTLSLRQEGVSTEESIVLKMDSTGSFIYQIPIVKNSFHYRSEAGDVHSGEYTITVTDRPFIRSLYVSIIPPRYSKMPQQVLEENIGDVTALAGTAVHWRLRPSKPLLNASIIMKGGASIPLKEIDGSYVGSFVLMQASSYSVGLEDTHGIANTDPIVYKLDILPDAIPTVTILVPGKNVDITEQMNIPLQCKVTDDYGITSLRIASRLIQSKYEKPQENFTYTDVPLDPATANEAVVRYQWDLTPYGLVPEDVIEYHVEAFDNDNISGPKIGKSESYLIRLPSLDEIFADADKAHDEAAKNLDASLREAEELKKDLDELSREMKKNKPLEWQEQKKAEEMVKKYEEIQRKIDDVNKKVDGVTQDLQKNNVLSQETLEKYMELQKTLQELNSPEFQQAMKRMMDAMQNVPPEQLRQAMQQIQFSEEAFRSSIERTLSLLKRIQVEQKVDELTKRAAELQQRQNELSKETAHTDLSDAAKAEELARKQDDLRRQLDQLQKQLQELRKKMEEFPKEMPMDELEKSEQAANNEEMESALQQSSQQLRNGQQQQSLQSQRRASQSMQKMGQQFSEMQQALLNNQMQEAVNGLRKAMQDLLELSQRQEQLKNESLSLDPQSAQFRQNAEKQLNVQNDLNTVANALAELSQKSFVVTPEMGRAIGNAMAHMNQSMNGLEQRNGQAAGTEQTEAMGSLNQAATLVQGSLEAMQQGGQSGSGMGSLLQQLQRMSVQQQSINAQTQQLGQGKELSQQQMQEMGRLAREQDAIRKSLEQLNKEAQGNPERGRILGDLQKITDEMKEIVENLQQNNVNPNTLQQQERILSRLLNAQRSMRERDYEQRRKAVAGRTPVRRSPADREEESAINQLRRDLQRAIEAGYSSEYQDLIRKYYDALERSKQGRTD